jgi:hypothetical protein
VTDAFSLAGCRHPRREPAADWAFVTASGRSGGEIVGQRVELAGPLPAAVFLLPSSARRPRD